jgi:hypothetical protein
MHQPGKLILAQQGELNKGEEEGTVLRYLFVDQQYYDIALHGEDPVRLRTSEHKCHTIVS